jgi:hypothetical protein
MSEPAYRVTGIEIGGEFIPVEDVPRWSLGYVADLAALARRGEMTFTFSWWPEHEPREPRKRNWWRGRKMSEGMRRRGL